MALWSGRFTENVSEFTQRFGASLPIDKQLYAQDIAGSKAHARMLGEQGVISKEDAQAIRDGLDRIQQRIEAGEFEFDINDEDIHMSIEKALIADIGEAGARLHTGRSRNDQVVTDTHLFAKQRCTDLMRANLELRRALVDQANKHFDVVLPGYTHMQHAQPVSSRITCLRMCGCSAAISDVWRPPAMPPMSILWVRLRWLALRTRSTVT